MDCIDYDLAEELAATDSCENDFVECVIADSRDVITCCMEFMSEDEVRQFAASHDEYKIGRILEDFGATLLDGTDWRYIMQATIKAHLEEEEV